MSKQIAEVAEAKFEELAEVLSVEVEDLTLTIEDGPMTSSIAGSDLVTEGNDESDDTSEAGEVEDEEQSKTEDTSEAGDDEVEVHFEEMEYNELQTLISEADVDYPEDTSFAGLVEAASNIEDVGAISEADEGQSETEDDSEAVEEEEDTSEAGEQQVSKADLLEAGVKESNIEDVRKYRSKNGVCSEENCPYGANNDSDFCASHQGSSSKSKTSTDSPKGNRELSDLSEAEKNLVSTLISDEGKSVEDAISMV